MATQVYEIKLDGQWKRVRARSMTAIDNYVNRHDNITDWRMVGMMSRHEILESKTLEIVA